MLDVNWIFLNLLFFTENFQKILHKIKKYGNIYNIMLRKRGVSFEISIKRIEVFALRASNRNKTECSFGADMVK